MRDDRPAQEPEITVECYVQTLDSDRDMKTNMEREESKESSTAENEDMKPAAADVRNDTTDEMNSSSNSEESVVSEEEIEVEQIVLARAAQSDYVSAGGNETHVEEKAMETKLQPESKDDTVSAATAAAAGAASSIPKSELGMQKGAREPQSAKSLPQVPAPPSEGVRRESSRSSAPAKETIPGTTRIDRSVTEPAPGAYAVSGMNDGDNDDGVPVTNLNRATSAPGGYAVDGLGEAIVEQTRATSTDETAPQPSSAHSAAHDLERGIQSPADESPEEQTIMNQSSASGDQEPSLDDERNGQTDIESHPEQSVPPPPSDGLIFAESAAYSHDSSAEGLIEAELVEDKLVVDAVATPSRIRLYIFALVACLLVVIAIIVVAVVVPNLNDSDSSPSFSGPTQAPALAPPTPPQPSGSDISYSQQLQLGQTIIGAAAFDLFGAPLSLSNNGKIVAIGARNSDEDGRDSGVVRTYFLDEEFDLWRPRGNAIRGENSGDKFGFSGLAINGPGTRLVAGAWLHKGRDEKPDAGQIRLFDYNEDTTLWDPVGQSIEGINAYDQFGRSAAISDDGRIFAGSSYQSNENGNFSAHVRVFEETMANGTVVWEQMGQTLLGKFAYARFGRSLALTADGLRLASGANEFQGSGPGYAQVFDYNGTDWVQIGQDLVGENDNDQFGRDISISKDGYILSVGANFGDDNGSSSGYVKTYTLETLQDGSQLWQEIANKIVGDTEEDRFGETISLSDDGRRIAVGASQRRIGGTGFVRVFDMAEDDEGKNYWTQVGEDLLGEVLGERFGADVHLSSDGTILSCGVVGSDANGDDSGAARLFNITTI